MLFQKRSFVKLLRVTVPVIILSGYGYSQCAVQQNAVTAAKAKINTDTRSLRQQRLGFTATDLEKWTNAADEEKAEIVKESLTSAISNFADYLLSTPKNLSQPMDIFGYHLPNGLGSLGTGQANTVIGRLRSNGITSPQLEQAIRALVPLQNKVGTLEYSAALGTVASSLKSTAEMETSNSNVDSVAALFGLAATLAGKEDFLVAAANATYKGGAHLFDLYFISKAVNGLSNTASSQLTAVNSFKRQIERDVGALQNAKATYDTCNNGVVQDQAQTPIGSRPVGGDPNKAALSAAVDSTSAAFKACNDPLGACISNCLRSNPPNLGACESDCGSCDAEWNAWNSALKALADSSTQYH